MTYKFSFSENANIIVVDINTQFIIFVEDTAFMVGKPGTGHEMNTGQIEQKTGETIGDIKEACLDEIKRIQAEINKTMFLAKNE